MGLFGGTTITVSSSVYNLAGDELDRPNFLKSSLFSGIMNPYETYLGETIVGNYLTGPGIMQRSFYNWAVRTDYAGLPTLKVATTTPIAETDIAPHIPVPGSPAGLVTEIQSAEFTDGNYDYWAEQYLIENAPTEVGTNWVADYDAANHWITIQYEGGGTVTIPGGSFNKNKRYAIARYYQQIPSSVEPLEVGTKTEDVLTPSSTAGYTLDSSANTGASEAFILNQVENITRTFSDGSPTVNEPTTYPTVNVTHQQVLHEWNRTDYIGQSGAADDTSSLEKWLYIWENREKYTDNVTGETDVQYIDMGSGVTQTQTTKTTGEFLRPLYDWQIDQQETVLEKVSGNKGIWIYEIGTGIPALDALANEGAAQSQPGYYPFIPVRLDNDSITESKFSQLYADSKTAYRRAVGGPTGRESLLGLVEEVEDNDDIDDIDYSYVQWGVSVNVFDPACRKYMYEWFRNQIPYQNTDSSTMATFKSQVNTYESDWQASQNWQAAQSDPFNSLYGTSKPSKPVMRDPPSTTVRLVSDHHQLDGFDNRYTWVNITETNHNGLGKSGAEQDDIWWEVGETFSWNVYSGIAGRLSEGFSFTTKNRKLKQMKLYRQTSANTYSILTIWGFVHENYIYKGKSVRTELREGVEDVTESVLIIPLHAPTVKTLGVVDFTQMALSNTFLTFNSYEVVKKKWYETFLGMLLIIIAIVVIAAVVAPAAVGGASGIFGTNAALGASFGLSGTSAVVAGAVANAIAATVIAQAISYGAVAIFGEKWGAIIGAIVSFAVTMGMSGGFQGGFSMGNMLNPQNILKLGSVLANGYNGFVQAEIAEIGEEMEENQEVYERATKEINDLMRSMGLTNDLAFNPMSLTDWDNGNGGLSTETGSYIPETADQFISRTTMTGSDVVDIAISMVTDYPDLQLTLPKA